MDVELSVDDQEIWNQRRQRLEALMGANPSQQQHDPAQPDKVMDPLLFTVAKKGDVDEFIRVLEHHCVREGVSLPILLKLRSPSGNTLFHAAAESDDNVKAVIDFVPEDLISCKNSRGETPLHIAARAGKSGAVELLLPRGNPRSTDHSGNSALHEAVRNCRYQVIRQLVREDPDLLYRQNKESKSPWCVAVETGDLRVLRVLLEAPIDGEDQSRSESERVSGMSPVHVAIIYQRRDMLEAMWAMKPWLFQLRDAGNGTPLHLAAYSNYPDGVRFLMEKCPTSALEQDSTDGYLPIHVACMMNDVMIVEELLRRWPDPAEFLTRLGQNILHVSASYGRIATVEYIMANPKFGHLINARDFDGNTPLHLAALHCQPSIIPLARDGRVDLKLVNKNNMTALDVADQDSQAIDAPFRTKLISIVLTSVGTPRSKELVICKPTGRSPWKRKEPQEPDRSKDEANTYMIVAALIASVTFTSGYSIPGGYNDSDHPDAGIPILLHKAMFNVFVISNSVAMYGAIMTIVTLLWIHTNDPYMMGRAVSLSKFPLSVTLAAMPLAFMAGVYVTVAKLAGLSVFVLVFGSIALYIILPIFLFLYYFPFWFGNSSDRDVTNIWISVVLPIMRGVEERRETAARAARSVRGNHDYKWRFSLSDFLKFLFDLYRDP